MSPAEQAEEVRALADAVCAELDRRAAGEAPDRRFDPLLAALADAAFELAVWPLRDDAGRAAP